MTAALTQVTERFRFLVAFRPGLTSPTLAAQMAATYQRVSGGRLLLNVVTGGDDAEQRRFGDFLNKAERYERAGELLHIVRELWAGEPVDFEGRHLRVQAAQIIPAADWPEIYFGGSSAEAVEVAAAQADVYLTWGEPPARVAEKLARVRQRGSELDRELRFGIRLHVITRDTSEEAWHEASRLLAGLSPEQIERAQAVQRSSQSEGQEHLLERPSGALGLGQFGLWAAALASAHFSPRSNKRLEARGLLLVRARLTVAPSPSPLLFRAAANPGPGDTGLSAAAELPALNPGAAR